MEKTNEITFKRARKPVLLIIFALFLLSGGISSLFPTLYLLSSRPLLGLLVCGLSLLSIGIAIGFLKMKKWSIYLYTFWLIIVAIIVFYFSFVTAQSIFAPFAVMLPALVILIYLWSISRKFTP
jgi:hypothetical protein